MANLGKRISGIFSRIKSGLMEHAYLVTLGAAVAVIVAAAMYTEQVNAQREQEIAAAARAAEITATATPAVTPLPTIAPLQLTMGTFAPRIVTVRPMSGKIIRAYSREPVLWEALGAIQVHEAIDIAGAEGESVLAAMDGVVAQAAMDALWGWRVFIEHTDGSVCTYAGLAQSFVSPGQSVSRGQALGTLLGAVPCEAELGAHLHLERTQNGIRQDPEGILPE